MYSSSLSWRCLTSVKRAQRAEQTRSVPPQIAGKEKRHGEKKTRQKKNGVGGCGVYACCGQRSERLAPSLLRATRWLAPHRGAAVQCGVSFRASGVVAAPRTRPEYNEPPSCFLSKYTSAGEMKRRHVDSIRPHPSKYCKTGRNISERLHLKALSIAPGLKANPNIPG